jgi:hypothetical protein
VNAVFEGTGNVLNSSINGSSYWCSNCHYDGNNNWTNINTTFNQTDWDVPVENSNPTDNSQGYVDHTATIQSNYSDDKCKECHGELLSAVAKMTQFVHNVAIGEGGDPNCATTSCHDSGGSGSAYVNVSIMNDSNAAHRLLNNRSGDPGFAVSVGNWNSRRCWACHSNGTATGGPEEENAMGINRTTPYLCPDCHLVSGSQFQKYFNTSDSTTNNIRSRFIVYEHYVGGEDLKASSNVFVPGTPSVNKSNPIAGSCVNCHNRSEMIIDNNDVETGTPSKWQGYIGDGDNNIGGNNSFYHYGRNRSNSSDASYLLVTRNSSRCGDDANTNCSKLNSFPTNTNYTYTNCSYCHMNSTTAFDVAMNDTGHKSMLNHTDSSNGPYCTDCHIAYDGNTTVRLHDMQLEKPFRNYTGASDRQGMLNSSLCTTCHLNQDVHADTELTGELDSDTLVCAGCHANVSNYTTGFGDKQIHGIRYINDSGVYSSEWDRTAAANCTTCHQRNLIGEIWINSTASVEIPKIPYPLNHSNNQSSGILWNTSSGGYFGPWKNPDSNNLRGCLYCHGNVNNSSTNIGDISNIVHNTTGLGRVNLLWDGVENILNGSIGPNSYWCSGCHAENNINRSNIVSVFEADGFEAPIENTNGSETRPGYLDHTEFFTTAYADDLCFNCHGSLLSDQSVGMDEFAHNVGIGLSGGYNCTNCHKIGGVAPKNINITALNKSPHSNINNRSIPGGDLYNSSKPCWACHGNGSLPPESDHPSNYKSPFYCTTCHGYDRVNVSDPSKKSLNYTAPIVRSHTQNGSMSSDSDDSARVTNQSTKCEICHNNALADGANGDGSRSWGNTKLFNTSHYLVANTSDPFGLPNSTLCSRCHVDDDIYQAYGFAPQVDEIFTGGGSTMDFNTTDNNEDCWQCHVGTTWYDPFGVNSGQTPERSFHDSLESNTETIIREIFNCYQSGCHVF